MRSADRSAHLGELSGPGDPRRISPAPEDSASGDPGPGRRPASRLEPAWGRPRAPGATDVGRFSLQSALIENTGLSAHCEAHLRSVIRAVIPD